MSAKRQDTQKHPKQPTTAQPKSAKREKDEAARHAGGVAHDPHNQTQERVDGGDPDAGDVDEETRSENAPFNKTYGHHE